MFWSNHIFDSSIETEVELLKKGYKVETKAVVGDHISENWEYKSTVGMLKYKHGKWLDIP